eukprot:scaffold21612_cov115-Isochrysis_galbana.AAC.8
MLQGSAPDKPAWPSLSNDIVYLRAAQKISWHSRKLSYADTVQEQCAARMSMAARGLAALRAATHLVLPNAFVAELPSRLYSAIRRPVRLQGASDTVTH